MHENFVPVGFLRNNPQVDQRPSVHQQVRIAAVKAEITLSRRLKGAILEGLQRE